MISFTVAAWIKILLILNSYVVHWTGRAWSWAVDNRVKVSVPHHELPMSHFRTWSWSPCFPDLLSWADCSNPSSSSLARFLWSMVDHFFSFLHFSENVLFSKVIFKVKGTVLKSAKCWQFWMADLDNLSQMIFSPCSSKLSEGYFFFF